MREFQTFLVLAERPDRVVTRPEIYALVWGGQMAYRDRSVDVFVRKVRRKLEACRARAGSTSTPTSASGTGSPPSASPGSLLTTAPSRVEALIRRLVASECGSDIDPSGGSTMSAVATPVQPAPPIDPGRRPVPQPGAVDDRLQRARAGAGGGPVDCRCWSGRSSSRSSPRNLDEFFQVRVAGLKQQAAAGHPHALLRRAHAARAAVGDRGQGRAAGRAPRAALRRGRDARAERGGRQGAALGELERRPARRAEPAVPREDLPGPDAARGGLRAARSRTSRTCR